MFDNSRWIWINNECKSDEYADFAVDFSLEDCNGVNLNIAVDGNFEAYLNGKLCALGCCSDYPDHKHYDIFALDEYCQSGKNSLKITVWHIGLESMTYAKSNPGLIFSVTQEGRELAVSDISTPSRKNAAYTSGLCKYITSQLGPSYRYDNTLALDEPYTASIEVQKSNNITLRPIKTLALLPRIDVSVDDDGKRLLIDWGKEAAGYLDLDFISEDDQELTIVFGEHLDDEGRVPRFIAKRDFSLEFVARKGQNTFFGGMRRIAGRYLEIEYEKPIQLGYIGIRPAIYPLNIKEKHFASELHQRIYDASVYTLICCMHEHYEDCPWREQALYSLDSRNQMLCGYVAFKEYEYARYNIILLSQGLNNGLIRITSPSDRELSIPFFSLTFIQQVYEYVKFSKDETIIPEVKSVLDAIMTTFTSYIDESGLIPALPKPAWNFYEWSKGNDGYKPLPDNMPRYDICLNSMFIYVYGMYKSLGGSVDADIEKMADGIKRVLFDEERGLFKTSNVDDSFSLVGNSLAILAGVADRSVAERLINERSQLIDITLSMNAFFYEALLSFKDDYKAYIIKDIENKYGHMLDEGATTFWETIEGWRAFGNAGSLCHGWSALPVYYLDLLI